MPSSCASRAAGTIYVSTLRVWHGYMQLRERAFRPNFPLDCIDPATRSRLLQTDSLPGRGQDWMLFGRSIEAYGDIVARRYRIGLENLRRGHEAGIPVAMGTDAGNPLTPHDPSVYPEIEAMAEAGFTPMQVLVASTKKGARAMGRTDFGTVEPGMLPDLVILDHNPLKDISNVQPVARVVRAGRVWARNELRLD